MFPNYTDCSVSIVRDFAGIAKGMFVTLREMFSKTMVEDYPSKKLPSKGAAFHERFRDIDCNPRGFAQTAQ